MFNPNNAKVLTLVRGSDLRDCEITVVGTFNFNHDNDDNDK